MKTANSQEALFSKIKVPFFFLLSLAMFLIALKIKFESIWSVSLWCVYTLVSVAFFSGHKSFVSPIGITLCRYLRRASCFLFIAYYLFFLTLAIGILFSNSATRPIPVIITADFIVLFFKCVTWPSIFLSFFSAISVLLVPCSNSKTAGLYFGLFASTCVLYKITTQLSSSSQIPFAIFQPVFPLLLGITFGILFDRHIKQQKIAELTPNGVIVQIKNTSTPRSLSIKLKDNRGVETEQELTFASTARADDGLPNSETVSTIAETVPMSGSQASAASTPLK